METIWVRNVREALPRGLELLARVGEVEASRDGPVIVAPCPVATTYEESRERVLMSPVRDANPFFHLIESLWMLGGRNDGSFLDNYVADFSARFAEWTDFVHDAYGRRWRRALGYDQLRVIAKMLRENSTTRQAVLQMWDGREGTEYSEQDLWPEHDWKTRPCNTHAYFRVRPETRPVGHGVEETVMELDVTVCCRSNDVIMGAYGANAVQFSVLQEYLARQIGSGVRVGRYCQVSNNYHVYLRDLQTLASRADLHVGSVEDNWRWYLKSVADACRDVDLDPPAPVPMLEGPGGETLDLEITACLQAIEDVHGWDGAIHPREPEFQHEHLRRTWWVAAKAYRLWRLAAPEPALETARRILHPEWRRACCEWLERRIARRSLERVAQDECPGHVASVLDARVCGRCGARVENFA